jgi:hypothetical protein
MGRRRFFSMIRRPLGRFRLRGIYYNFSVRAIVPSHYFPHLANAIQRTSYYTLIPGRSYRFGSQNFLFESIIARITYVAL